MDLGNETLDGSTQTNPPRQNGNATADLRTAAISRSASYNELLLSVKLEEHRHNPEKLLNYAVALQSRCRELSKAAQDDLNRSHSATSSRINSSDTISRQKKAALEAARAPTILIFNQMDYKIEEAHLKDINESDYIQGDLPWFHWWNDHLHIYFEKDANHTKHHGRQKVIVRKKKFLDDNERDRTLIATVKLGKLGLGIKMRRIFGQLKTIYVLCPQQELLTFGPSQSVSSTRH